MNKPNKPKFIADKGFEITHNIRGFMHQLNEIGQDFIDFAPTASGLIVDIGAAYGVTTIPIIEQQIAVTACDMEMSHLQELQSRIPQQYHQYLTVKQGQFPGHL